MIDKEIGRVVVTDLALELKDLNGEDIYLIPYSSIVDVCMGKSLSSPECFVYIGTEHDYHLSQRIFGGEKETKIFALDLISKLDMTNEEVKHMLDFNDPYFPSYDQYMEYMNE